jgi:hypothetical protein
VTWEESVDRQPTRVRLCVHRPAFALAPRSGGTVSDKLIMLATAGCGDDACPTVYLDKGRLTVQGQEVSTADLPRVAPGEAAVSIDIETVRAALAKYDAGGYA